MIILSNLEKCDSKKYKFHFSSDNFEGYFYALINISELDQSVYISKLAVSKGKALSRVMTDDERNAIGKMFLSHHEFRIKQTIHQYKIKLR